MTARHERFAGTILELGVCRPLAFCAAAWVVGSVLGAARGVYLLAMAEDVDVEAPDALPWAEVFYESLAEWQARALFHAGLLNENDRPERDA